MFIGHLPGAYLALKPATARLAPQVFAWAMIGSVAPDIDLVAFYFWHDRAFHHHEYLTHRPVLWAAALAGGLFLLWLGRIGAGRILGGLGTGGLIHMALDSIAGKIAWGWPLTDAAAPLVVVPATKSHWILSFLTHWTFAVELAVCTAALGVFIASRRRWFG